MLLSFNARFNLTAITQKEEIEGKHFLDSLAGEQLFPHGAKAVEVGSGAGFPSIPSCSRGRISYLPSSKVPKRSVNF